MPQLLQERKQAAVELHLTPRAAVPQCLLLLVCCQRFAVDHPVLLMYVNISIALVIVTGFLLCYRFDNL